MHYLVTGGAGFIGSHTVDELIRRGHRVRVLDDLSAGNLDNLAHVRKEVEFTEGSVTNQQLLSDACRGIDRVIHLAAQVSVPRSVKDPLETHQINGTGTLNVLIAARQAGVKRVVFASSCAVYGKTDLLPIPESAPTAPISPYGVSKLLGEWYGRIFLDLYGLEFVALRYFNVFGPRQDPGSPYSGVLSLFNTAVRNRTQPAVYGDGEQSRDFVYIGNVAEANCVASEAPMAPGHSINIGMGARTTLNQTLSLLGKITGRPLVATHGPARDGDIRDSQADISSAKALLGYDPKITFEQGLKKTWEWFSAGPA